MSYGPDQIKWKDLPSATAPEPVNTIYLAGVVSNLDLDDVLTVQVLLQDANGRLEPITQRLAIAKDDDPSNVAIQVALRFIDPTRPVLLCHTLPYPPTLDLSRYPNLALKHLNRAESPAYQRLLARRR